MQLDDHIVLSQAGREVVVKELVDLLRKRRNARELRSRAIQDGFSADAMLVVTQERCGDLCSDLGFSNEIEAEEALLDGRALDGQWEAVDMAAPGADHTVTMTVDREQIRREARV